MQQEASKASPINSYVQCNWLESHNHCTIGKSNRLQNKKHDNYELITASLVRQVLRTGDREVKREKKKFQDPAYHS